VGARLDLNQRDEVVAPHRGHHAGEPVAGALAGDGLLRAPFRQQAGHLALWDQAMAAAGALGA
jgi:hypothetical protein